MPFLPSLPRTAMVKDLFSRRPEIYGPFNAANQVLMRGPSPLSEGERELIGAFVSALTGCRYCTGAHAETARLFGIREGLLKDLVENFDSADVPGNVRPLLAFVRKLTRSPARMTQSDADAVFEAGWNETALHDAIAVTAFFTFMNRLVLGHGLAADESQFAARGRRHFEEGYLKQHYDLYQKRSPESDNSADS